MAPRRFIVAREANISQQASRKPGLRSRPSAGRPTRAQAEQRHEELLNRALDIFLDHGFERTTIEEVAVAVGMSKRTVYARYVDKSALFTAAVSRAIERYTVPKQTLRAAVTEDLEETLTEVARIRVANLMAPSSIKLQRILMTEAHRFAALNNDFFDQAIRPTTEFLSELFVERTKAGELNITEPRRAATAFLSLVAGGPAWIFVTGNVISAAELDARICFAVRIFLDGVRRRGQGDGQ